VAKEILISTFLICIQKPNSLYNFLKGIVVDADESNPINATVQLIDLETGQVVENQMQTQSNGSYLVSIPNGKDYALNATAKNYLFYSENFSLKDHPAEKPFLLNVSMKKISVDVACCSSQYFLRNRFLCVER
jgi:hypothetical protein